MIGMGLLWGWQGAIPDWIKNGGYNRDQLITIVENHITTVMTRYKGKIGAYVVVNEAFNPGPSPGDWWDQHIGSDYVRIAFQKARQVDPNAVLIYNHYLNETRNGTNYGITKRDVDDLKSLGLVDAVGVQLHLWGGRPAKTEVNDTLKSYGLPVWVTEFDCYQLSWVSDPPQEQATITQSMMEAALESGVCDCFTNWGISDKNSVWGASNKPCLWDESNNAKPNYYAMQQAMSAKVTLVIDLFLPLIMR